MRVHLVRFSTICVRRSSERGATAVEYGLLLAAVAAVIAAAVSTLGEAVLAMFLSVPSF